jgi:Flp pilus assembly protein CpaB
VLVRRRPLAALLVAVATLVGLRAVAAPAPATVPVPVAARDLAAGEVLAADDVATAAFAPGTEPSRVVTDAVGRVLAAPVSAGEPLTPARLVGPGLVAADPGLTALPVRLPDPGVVGLLRVGDRVDLLATDPEAGTAEVLAVDVPVLAIPVADDPVGGLTGRLVVVGVHPEDALDVTGATLTRFLSVAFSR